MTTTPSRDEMLARLAELRAANEAATSWGAAVGARSEEIRDLERRLAVSASDGSQKETPLAKQELPGADRSVSETSGVKYSAADIIDQHIGWIKFYAEGMSATNWRDRQLYIERQIDALSDAFDAIKPAVAETDANAPDDARLVSGATLNPTSHPPESGER